MIGGSEVNKPLKMRNLHFHVTLFHFTGKQSKSNSSRRLNEDYSRRQFNHNRAQPMNNLIWAELKQWTLGARTLTSCMGRLLAVGPSRAPSRPLPTGVCMQRGAERRTLRRLHFESFSRFTSFQTTGAHRYTTPTLSSQLGSEDHGSSLLQTDLNWRFTWFEGEARTTSGSRCTGTICTDNFFIFFISLPASAILQMWSESSKIDSELE